MIGTPWQGAGYAAEAAAAMVAWLGDAGVGTIEATIAPGHTASEAVAGRIGLAVTDALVDGERVWRRPGAD